MAGEDYRQLQAPEQVNTSLPDNGAAARAEALGSLFKEFEGISGNVYSKAQTQAGALAGAAEGATGHPQYREGLERFTAYSQAFNNAATGAYAIQAEAQANDAAARLRVQSNNNPDTFRTTFSAVRDSVLKVAPEMAKPMLTELYNKHLAEGLATVSGDQAAEQRQVSRQVYDVGVERQTSKVALLMGSANVQDQLAGRDEQVKLSLMIDGGLNSGLYSKAEAEAKHVMSMREITSQVFDTQVDRELATPDGAGIDRLLDNFRAAHLANLADKNATPILAEPEFQKLMQDAITKVREWRIEKELANSGAKTEQQLRWEAGDVHFTSQLFDGKLTHRALSAAVTNGDLKPETARSLGNALETATVNRTDPVVYAATISRPDFLDLKADDLAHVAGVSTADKKNLMNEQARQKANWEGSQPVKDGKAVIAAGLKIPAGTNPGLLSDDQKKAYANATNDYVARMQKVDPAQRAGQAIPVANAVVHDMQKSEAQSQILGIQNAIQRTLKDHGPGSKEEWPADKLKTRIDQQNSRIKTLQQQLKGP
jgi:hypothetical protein